MKRVLALGSVAVVLAGCCRQPPEETTTLGKVVEATINGVRQGEANARADAEKDHLNPIGLRLCTVEQTWTIASSRMRDWAATVNASGAAASIPVTIGGNVGGSTANSNSNVVHLTWSNPRCPMGGAHQEMNSGGRAGGDPGGGQGHGGGGSETVPQPTNADDDACRRKDPLSLAEYIPTLVKGKMKYVLQCYSPDMEELKKLPS